MAIFIRLSFVLLAMLAAAPAVSGSNLSQLSLTDAVSAAMQRHSGDERIDGSTPYRSSNWLAALPSIGISYLASDENQGSDETELSVSLPIKSGAGRKHDKQLRQLAGNIQDTEAQRRRLFLSGLVRESLWSHRIARTRKQFSEKKITLLEELLERQQALFETRSASRYSLLLIQQEITDARILQQSFDWEAEAWRQRFKTLTGIATIPEDIIEAALEGPPNYSQHPQLRLLDLDWRRQQAVIAAESESSTPWTVALTAKQLDNPQFDENQYGMAVEIPISAINISSESSRAAWQEASRSYRQSRDELQLELKHSWDSLNGEADHLLIQQALMDESARISQQLVTENRSLLGENELAREIWVRRLLDDIDKQANAAINKLLIDQNLAMKRQATGISL